MTRRIGFVEPSRRKLRRLLRRRGWRKLLLSLVHAWNRSQVPRVLAAVLVTWVTGASALFVAERAANPDYATWMDSLWNVGVLLFSGLDSEPKTAAGRVTAMVLMVMGVGLAGLFTASVASLLIERYLGRRNAAMSELENHLILCNWSPLGLDWIREVHSKIIHDKRPVVIIHDEPDEIDLPDKQDDPAFNDVYIVKGDPSNEVILRRARVQFAHSVVVLSDDREGKHTDGKSILICISVRNLCRGDKQPNLAAECHDAQHRNHLKKAGADEVISSADLGLRLLARSALYHGMTRVYQELLTVRRDANEMYFLPAPEALVGKDFVELAGMFARHRGDKRSCLLLGIQRDDEMLLNPINGDVGLLRADDQLILLSRVVLDPTQPLPTDPPIAIAPRAEEPRRA